MHEDWYMYNGCWFICHNQLVILDFFLYIVFHEKYDLLWIVNGFENGRNKERMKLLNINNDPRSNPRWKWWKKLRNGSVESLQRISKRMIFKKNISRNCPDAISITSIRVKDQSCTTYSLAFGFLVVN